MTLPFFILAAGLSSLVGSIAGVGGGLLLLVSLSFLVPATSLVPIHACVQSFLCGTRTVIFRSDINWDITKKFYLGMVPTTASAALVISQISSYNSGFLLVVIACYVLLSTIFPKIVGKFAGLDNPVYLGAVCGFLGMFVGSTGPIVSTWLLGNGIIKEEHIATKSTMQSLAHFLKILAFMTIAKTSLVIDISVIVSMCLVGLVCTIAGKRLLLFVDGSLFVKYVKTLLVIVSLSILYKGWEGI